ncbi:hypothetical protein L195_g005796 [Trifolium pratense]|uniref:Uncharacterized protein n=1 Tax=Trifolium pratense TaxID=57577 RepID=A0A2K3P1S6_TRIPR|nr:hypothetical protein L195_g005796 [Trifolium pratense]
MILCPPDLLVTEKEALYKHTMSIGDSNMESIMSHSVVSTEPFQLRLLMEDESSSSFGTLQRCMTNVNRNTEMIMLAVPTRI